MNRKLINRRIAGALTAVVVLGSAGPAAARFDLNSQAPPGESATHYQKANVLPPYTGVKVPYYGKANVLAPFVPRHMKTFAEPAAAAVATTTPRAVVNRPAAGGSDLIYVLAGGAVFAIGGLGGAFVAGRRHGARTTAPVRPNVAG